MQTCIENAAPALVESTSASTLESTNLPLFDSTALPQIEPVPTWTIRIARPTSAHRNELAQELRGVPKASLRHVFGKVLGTRLWQQNRAATATVAANDPTDAKPAPAASISDRSLVADTEISSGMLRYLCAEAATTLREGKRLAKSISLTVRYPNGESETAHQLLLTSTADPASLEAAAQAAIRGMRSDAFVSLKLNVTAAAQPAEAAARVA
jgi:impB/mucB/samB family C-terminal domain